MNAVTPLAASGPTLAVRGLSFAAGTNFLLRDIDLTFHSSGCSAVLGPNGAGKSLLLRLCHGLLTPSAGQILWDGEPLSAEHLRRQAIVFQRPVMLRRSALANVAYPLKLGHLDGRERTARAAAALERFGLSALARHPARVLSEGEQQRLALARAWVVRPTVLLLDEPTAALDPASSAAVEEAIRAFLQAGTKVVMVTHHLALARRLAQEVVLLGSGRLVEQASCQDFFSRPATVEARAFLAGEFLW